ncbi:uncharacterized protein, partial [Anas platyrhynchos]|uniref:uncharacterized protein n=1 Tax=Anas platyrhynchos TaxID=8839 RepID=UPI003AF291E9
AAGGAGSDAPGRRRALGAGTGGAGGPGLSPASRYRRGGTARSRRGAGMCGRAGGRPVAARRCPGRAALPPPLALEDKSGGNYLWGPPQCPGRHCPYKDWGTGPGGHVGARVRPRHPAPTPRPPRPRRAPRAPRGGGPGPGPARPPGGRRQRPAARRRPGGGFRWRGPWPKKARIRPRPACPKKASFRCARGSESRGGRARGRPAGPRSLSRQPATAARSWQRQAHAETEGRLPRHGWKCLRYKYRRDNGAETGELCRLPPGARQPGAGAGRGRRGARRGARVSPGPGLPSAASAAPSRRLHSPVLLFFTCHLFPPPPPLISPRIRGSKRRVLKFELFFSKR